MEQGPHTYLDDLESFFYVLCWILASFEGPGNRVAEVPQLVALWDDPASHILKLGLFSGEFILPVSPWFGLSFRNLAAHLHHFFDVREDLVGKPFSSLDPAKDYDEYISHIRQSIVDLEREVLEGEGVCTALHENRATIPHVHGMKSRKRGRGSLGDDEESDLPSARNQRPRSKHATVPPCCARPRRSTANYD